MKKIYLFSLLLLSFVNGFTQSIFDNPITGTNPNTTNPYIIGQTVNANITVSGIGRGTGIVGAAANDRYNASGLNSVALDVNDYFEFTITPNASFSVSFISFAFTLQRSGTGPTSAALRSSLDAYGSDIGAVTTAATPGVLNTIDLSATAYQSLSSAITFRIYGWGASAAAGTLSVNDFTFNGVTSVLPVKIEYLNGVKQGNSNTLSWKVNCTSTPSATMSIERSADGRSFSSIGNISADALRCLQPFSYIDAAPLSGYSYYRLKMTDASSVVTYSTVITIINKETGFDIRALMPSIVSTSAVLNTSAAKKTQLNIAVTDFAGRQVLQSKHSLVAGSNQIEFNFSTLAAGAYQITATTAEGDKKTIRFVKQ